MALNMIGNKLTEKDIELLKLEEKRRKLHDEIENDACSGQEQNQKLFQEYRQINQEIRSIAYTAAGIFDDARFGHLLDRNNELNLKLLQKWRLRKMEEMTAEELFEDVKEILSEKEFCVFVKFYLEDKSYAEIIEEMDISKGYGYDLKSRAKKKIEEEYVLDKVLEILSENKSYKEIDVANVSDAQETEESAENNEKEVVEEEAQEQLSGPPEELEDDDPEPQEEEKLAGVFVAFDDNLEVDDMEQISELITRIQGVSHISEKSHEVEELKKEVASILDNY